MSPMSWTSSSWSRNPSHIPSARPTQTWTSSSLKCVSWKSSMSSVFIVLACTEPVADSLSTTSRDQIACRTIRTTKSSPGSVPNQQTTPLSRKPELLYQRRPSLSVQRPAHQSLRTSTHSKHRSSQQTTLHPHHRYHPQTPHPHTHLDLFYDNSQYTHSLTTFTTPFADHFL